MNTKQGFTLIELLIVISIIAILAGVVFVALDPATRFQDTRDSRRAADVDEFISAIKLDQLDNDGTYVDPAITGLTDNTNYMIGTCTGATSPTCAATPCDVTILAANGVDLAALVTEGYLGEISISPDGTGTWSAIATGYYVNKSSTGAMTVGACESENTTAISASR